MAEGADEMQVVVAGGLHHEVRTSIAPGHADELAVPGRRVLQGGALEQPSRGVAEGGRFERMLGDIDADDDLFWCVGHWVGGRGVG